MWRALRTFVPRYNRRYLSIPVTQPDTRTLHRLLIFVPHAASEEELDIILHGCTHPEQFTSVLSALDTRKDWQSMVSVLQYMKGQGVAPNGFHYSAVIGALGEAKRMYHAKEQFQAAVQAGVADVNVWTAMMSAWLHAGKAGNAVKVFERMKEHGVSPTVVTYNVVLRALVLWEQPQEVMQMFQEMQEAGHRPTANTYAHVFNACSGPQEVEAMLRDIVDNDVLRSISIWHALVAKYCQVDDMDNAMKGLERMQKYSCTPDLGIFHVLMNCCQRLGDGRHAIEVLDLAKHQGITMTRTLINGVVTACAKGGMLDQALSYFRSMENQGFEPTALTMEVLLQACVDGKRWQDGLALLKLSSTVIPSDKMLQLTAIIEKEAWPLGHTAPRAP